MKNIIAAIDYSDVTPAVIEAASAQARAFDAELHLVHVWDPEASHDTGYGALPSLAINVSDERLAEEKDRIEAEAKRLADTGLRCAGTLVIGHPSTAIIKYATESGGDLVIVGSHGHTALGSLIMGSCSSALVRKAVFPLLVIPALPPDADRE